MVTVYNCQHMTWNGGVSVAHYELFADESSDLPTTTAEIEAIIGEKHTIAQGSIAWVVATSKVYMYNSEGEWVLQNA